MSERKVAKEETERVNGDASGLLSSQEESEPAGQGNHDPSKPAESANEIKKLLEEVESKDDKLLSQKSLSQNQPSQGQQSHPLSQASSTKSPEKAYQNPQQVGKKRSIDSESGDISLSQPHLPMSQPKLQDSSLEQTD